MNASVVEAVAERMEILEAERDLLAGVLRDVKQLARAALVDVAAGQTAGHVAAASFNAISTRIVAAQQALKVTEDAEHKHGHERDDAELLAWAASVGFDNLEPASRLKALAARKRRTLREHGEALLRLNAADPTLAAANEPRSE